MPTPQTGGCLCGKVRYEADSEAVHSIQCYCRDCQHISGGGHTGNNVVLGFFGECGSPIYKTKTLAPELIFFFAGSLDNAAEFSPQAKVYKARRQPWDMS